jgi:membrane fusion protein
LATLEQESIESASSREVAILAPADGVVSVQMAKRGESVQAGQPILSVLQANSRLEAELAVPSSAIGFVSPGDRVRLRYEAYPFQKFGQYLGTIRRVGRSPTVSAGVVAAAGSARADTVYKVVVELDSQYVTAYGKHERLMPGMSLQADILGERRNLIDWIFEPLYSLRGNVMDR